MHTLAIQTEEGEFSARYSSDGLAELRFPSRESITQSACPEVLQDWHILTTAAVRAILSGCVPNLLPPLDLRGHTQFQRNVWEQLRRIRISETVSYAQVAQRLGKPGATRAVGGACGANPIPLFIPCHRVLATGNRLGGFSGGLDWKRKLLALEGVTINSAHTRKSIRAPGQPELFGQAVF